MHDTHRQRLRAQAALLLVVLCAGACNKPQPPTVTPHMVRVVGINSGGVDLDIQLSVHNPNPFPISAQAVEGTLFVSRHLELGHGSSKQIASIPAGATSVVASRLHMSWPNLSSVVPLLTSERIPYEFSGDVAVGGESLNVKLPFTLTGELTRDELVQAGFRGF